MESILNSIKKQLGIHEEYDHFDDQIVMHINSVFMILNQLGVGPEEGFWIEDDVAAWSDFLEDPTQLQIVKTYMGHKVRMMFDPPSNGTIANAMNAVIAELEWRLNIAVDPKQS